MTNTTCRRLTRLLCLGLIAALCAPSIARASVDPRTLEKPAATQFNLRPASQVPSRQMMDLDYAQIQIGRAHV